MPGDVEGSLLIEAVRGADSDFLMPPSKRLADSEIAILEEWVRRGAPDPRVLEAGGKASHHLPGGGVSKEAGHEHWAFQPIASPRSPRSRMLDGEMGRSMRSFLPVSRNRA